MKDPIIKARLNTEEQSIEIPHGVWRDISKLSDQLSSISYNPYYSARTNRRVSKALVEIMVDLIHAVNDEADPF